MVICVGIYFMVSGSDVKLSCGRMVVTSPNTIGTTILPQPFHHKHSTTTLQLLQPLQPTFLTLPRETLQLLSFSWNNQDSLSWSTGMKISGLSWGRNSRHPTEDMYLGEYNKIVILCLKTYCEKTNHHIEVLLRKLHL